MVRNQKEPPRIILVIAGKVGHVYSPSTHWNKIIQYTFGLNLSEHIRADVYLIFN